MRLGLKPELGIVHERKDDKFTILSIDTQKASYQGHNWHSLSQFYKRKFENLVVLTRPNERLKIVYGNT